MGLLGSAPLSPRTGARTDHPTEQRRVKRSAVLSPSGAHELF